MAGTGFTLTRKGVIIIVAISVAVVAAISVAAWWFLTQNSTGKKAAETASPTPAITTAAAQPIVVAAMGDMLPHDSVNLNAKQADGTYDYGQFFTNILPIYKDAEVVFCNQEVPSAGEALGISGYPVFNAPEQFAIDLHDEARCNVINLANNHAADLGPAGITRTREVWDGLKPLSISGTNRSVEEQNTIVYSDVDGVTFALVSFAEYSNSPIDDVSLNKFGNTTLFDSLITQARANADIVLVSMHWGTEDSHAVNSTQQTFAQRAADLGADVVLGTGPHVLQPVTWLNRPDGGRTLVWYSLGNMLSTQLNLNQRIGVIATFEVNTDSGKPVIENPTAHLTYMHYDWTAAQESAGDLLSRTNLSINPLGASAALLANTRFNTTPEQVLSEMAGILGSEVTVVAD